MNQEKTGNFIRENRKAKNLTQAQLAEKLGVSDRTVGNWENGRNMPDLILFKPLCDELDITINDLMAGEKVDEKDYKETLEENIINTIDYSNKRSNRVIKILITLFTLLFVVFIVIIIMISTKNRYNEKDMEDYPFYQTVYVDEQLLVQPVTDYLIHLNEQEDQLNSNSRPFVSFRIFSVEEKEKGLYYSYIWVLRETYYSEGSILKSESSSSYPCRILLEKKNDEFIVKESNTPRDGSYYSEDMKKLFPQYVLQEITDAESDGTFDDLYSDNLEQAKAYFTE